MKIRFKDYLMDRQAFDRLLKQSPMTPAQAKPFLALTEVLSDAVKEYAALQTQLKGKEKDETFVKLHADFLAFPEQELLVPGYAAVPVKSLGWLRLSADDYAVLKKHKVLKD